MYICIYQTHTNSRMNRRRFRMRSDYSTRDGDVSAASGATVTRAVVVLCSLFAGRECFHGNVRWRVLKFRQRLWWPTSANATVHRPKRLSGEGSVAPLEEKLTLEEKDEGTLCFERTGRS